MNLKVFNALLVLTSLFGYLEWGGENQIFLFQAEMELIRKLAIDPMAAAHPFTLVPLLGQMLLLITLLLGFLA
jgi:hypothetical protein